MGRVWRGTAAHLVHAHTFSAQGKVMARTYTLRGCPLTPEEREKMEAEEGEEVKVTWEKMSKSKTQCCGPPGTCNCS